MIAYAWPVSYRPGESSLGTTTTIHLDALRTDSGTVSVSYTPHNDRVQLSIYESDLFRAAQSIVLSSDGLERLKAVLVELDSVIRDEKAKRHTSGTAAASFDASGDSVLIPIGKAGVSLPSGLYAEVATLVADGQVLVAAARITKELPWMPMSGAREVAQSLADFQRAVGDRS